MQEVLLAILCLIPFSSDLRAGEKLLYAVRSESLKRYPDIVYTKIHSFDPAGRENHLVFSDENVPIMLLARRGMPGHPVEVLVSTQVCLLPIEATKNCPDAKPPSY
jgi:hypothetical protein